MDNVSAALRVWNQKLSEIIKLAGELQDEDQKLAAKFWFVAVQHLQDLWGKPPSTTGRKDVAVQVKLEEHISLEPASSLVWKKNSSQTQTPRKKTIKEEHGDRAEETERTKTIKQEHWVEEEETHRLQKVKQEYCNEEEYSGGLRRVKRAHSSGGKETHSLRKKKREHSDREETESAERLTKHYPLGEKSSRSLVKQESPTLLQSDSPDKLQDAGKVLFASEEEAMSFINEVPECGSVRDFLSHLLKLPGMSFAKIKYERKRQLFYNYLWNHPRMEEVICSKIGSFRHGKMKVLPNVDTTLTNERMTAAQPLNCDAGAKAENIKQEEEKEEEQENSSIEEEGEEEDSNIEEEEGNSWSQDCDEIEVKDEEEEENNEYYNEQEEQRNEFTPSSFAATGRYYPVAFVDCDEIEVIEVKDKAEEENYECFNVEDEQEDEYTPSGLGAASRPYSDVQNKPFYIGRSQRCDHMNVSAVDFAIQNIDHMPQVARYLMRVGSRKFFVHNTKYINKNEYPHIDLKEEYNPVVKLCYKACRFNKGTHRRYSRRDGPVTSVTSYCSDSSCSMQYRIVLFDTSPATFFILELIEGNESSTHKPHQRKPHQRKPHQRMRRRSKFSLDWEVKS